MKRRDFINRAGISSLGLIQIPFFPGEKEPSLLPEAIFLPRKVTLTPPYKVSMIRAKKLKDSIKHMLDMINALEDIKKGESVLIKPAVNSDNPFPATTSPQLIKVLIDLLKEREVGRIVVADRAGIWRNTLGCMSRCGILEASKGAEILALEYAPWFTAHISGGKHWAAGIKFPMVLKEIDHLISLPTIRTHFLAGFTMSLKNMVGLIPMLSRMYMHLPFDLGKRISELSLVLKPTLIILDGRRVFTKGGPDTGRIEECGLLLAGRDPVSIDVVGLSILRHIGTIPSIQEANPWETSQIKRAVELGIGTESKDDIEIMEEGVSEIKSIKRYLGQ